MSKLSDFFRLLLEDEQNTTDPTLPPTPPTPPTPPAPPTPPTPPTDYNTIIAQLQASNAQLQQQLLQAQTANLNLALHNNVGGNNQSFEEIIKTQSFYPVKENK